MIINFSLKKIAVIYEKKAVINEKNSRLSTIFQKKDRGYQHFFKKKKFTVINIRGYQHSQLSTLAVINTCGYQFAVIDFSVIIFAVIN